MSEFHLAYLSLGSNIQPEVNLVRAIQLLLDHGRLEKISNAWESRSVGAEGPNYLNVCLSLNTKLEQADLKENVLLPIEDKLGRKRSENRFAPRTMDIDIILFDEESCDDRYWEQSFVVIPLAEIHPEYQNPLTHEPVIETAARLQRKFWMEAHRDVLKQYNGNQFTT
jgi:2-amino-4-hydroxy-6-hydroxymethyldihydropteridine diphosphokinase